MRESSSASLDIVLDDMTVIDHVSTFHAAGRREGETENKSRSCTHFVISRKARETLEPHCKGVAQAREPFDEKKREPDLTAEVGMERIMEETFIDII